MSAAEACNGHVFQKRYVGKRTLSKCTTRKRDSIVYIEVDEDFNDVIILDVPESFQQKFRKKPKHVISIDDDDDGGGGGGEGRGAACDTNANASTGNKFSPTAASDSLNSANVDGDFVSEGNIPVKLSKSKRTYSGNNISRNQYGSGPDFETCSSESDCSDCEFMGESFVKVHEQVDKVSFTKRHETGGPSDFQNRTGTSAPSQPVHYSAEDVTKQHSERFYQQSDSSHSSLNHEQSEKVSFRPRPDTSSVLSDFKNKSCQPVHHSAEEVSTHSESSGQQSNSSNSSLNHDGDDALAESAQKPAEEGLSHQQDSEMNVVFRRERTSSESSNYDDDPCAADCPGQHVAEKSTGEHPEFPGARCGYGISVDHENNDLFNDSTDKLGNRNYSPKDADKEMNKFDTPIYFTDVMKGFHHENGERKYSVSFEREHGAGSPSISCNVGPDIGNNNEPKFPDDQSIIITDRQKMKETDEYKRALEEELASRQQQLQRQGEEARRLRDRKRAEKMRLMVNEQRQKHRLEEIRETRRKDEEKINTKEKLRAQIKKELRKFEKCRDMASLLRCLGIPIGSGGPYPSLNEVQAAYKRACLKFHPDRLSAYDLQQQVEAEEKFKLISNMKDRFLLL